MPLYDYRCNGCLREFEVQQPMADPDLVKCEVCGEDKLEKVISWTHFGSGGFEGVFAPNPREAIKVDRIRRPPQQRPKKPEPEPEAAPKPDDESSKT